MQTQQQQQTTEQTRSREDVTALMTDLSGIEGVLPPANQREQKRLQRILSEVSTENPLVIYVGSCPDYTHHNGLYTHEGLGEDVPLLTTLHLQRDMGLLDVLDRHHLPYEYIIMVADVEAEDEIFVSRFSGGDQEEFRRRCHRSVAATQEIIDRFIQPHHQGKIRSSSFFTEFGDETFMYYQEAYRQKLEQQYLSDSSFQMRVVDETMKRSPMYRKMYPHDVGGITAERDRVHFLHGRTMRTMAQYLTLGRLISESTPHGVIINHPTLNIPMFNSGNKYTLAKSESYVQPAIPIFQLDKKVYE
jgi:hypothetical protein